MKVADLRKELVLRKGAMNRGYTQSEDKSTKIMDISCEAVA